jgi:hypothetical protein
MPWLAKVAENSQGDFVDMAHCYFSTAAESRGNLRRIDASISRGVGAAGVGNNEGCSNEIFILRVASSMVEVDLCMHLSIFDPDWPRGGNPTR